MLNTSFTLYRVTQKPQQNRTAPAKSKPNLSFAGNMRYIYKLSENAANGLEKLVTLAKNPPKNAPGFGTLGGGEVEITKGIKASHAAFYDWITVKYDGAGKLAVDGKKSEPFQFTLVRKSDGNSYVLEPEYESEQFKQTKVKRLKALLEHVNENVKDQK